MLTDREKEVIECLLSAWTQSDMELYGHLCYQDVFDLMRKLGVDPAQAETELNTRFSHFSKNVEKLDRKTHSI